MLRLADGTEFEYQSNVRKWVITSEDLRTYGIRSPQGFSFQFGNRKIGNFFWTSNEFAAYLFHRRFDKSAPDVSRDFAERRKLEDYLYNLSFSTSSDMKLQCPEGVEYRPHQVSGIEYCLFAKNVLIADEQRIGKTIVAIGTINNLPQAHKIIVVCPKTAKLGWLQELKKWLITKRRIQVVNAQSMIDPMAEVYIINYDILHIQTDLLDINFDIVIADECHMVARIETRRAKFFLALKAKKILGLSGTPLLNEPKDLLAIAKWLDPFWEPFFSRQDKFLSNSGISLTLDEAQDIMRSSILLRRLQAQVFECEPVEKRIVPIEPSATAKPFVEMELRKLEDYTKVRKVLGLHKVHYAVNHINTYTSEGEKIVVFAYHNEVIERLKTSLGSKAVCIYGKSSEAEREVAKLKFANDPTCTVLLGSIGSASMALNLSVSHHIVFVECDWSNGMMAQAEERCSDKTQKSDVLVEYLVFEDSLDHYILNKVDAKNKVVDKGIDMVY